jgi:hypothetical protein
VIGSRDVVFRSELQRLTREIGGGRWWFRCQGVIGSAMASKGFVQSSGWVLALWAGLACGDEFAAEPPRGLASGAEERTGTLIELPLPLTNQAVQAARDQFETLASTSSERSERPVVALQLGEPGNVTPREGTRFEDALALARVLTSPEASRVASVAYLAEPLEGHSILVALACEQWVAHPKAVLRGSRAESAGGDPTVELVYQSIAGRRGTMPPAAVRTLFPGHRGLTRLELADGSQQFADATTLDEARASGQVVREQVLVGEGQVLNLNADQLRQVRWTTHTAEPGQELLDALRLRQFESAPRSASSSARAGLVLLNQPLTPRIAKRTQRSIADALDAGVNRLLIQIDVTDADLAASVELAEYLSSIDAGRTKIECLVNTPIAPPATLIAVSGHRLWMGERGRLLRATEARSGDLSQRQLQQIDEIASRRQRSSAVMRQLLGSEEAVYRWTHRRSGRVALAAELDRVQEGDLDSWERGPLINSGDGLSAEQALEWGLADRRAESLEQVAAESGLEQVPPPIRNRWLVSELESLAGRTWLIRLLLFIGFFALSVEMGSPGVGVPGFIAIVCLMVYFWAQFFNGNAEWLELLLFVVGLACLAIELLILPGFGIFGLGGVIMIIASLTLASQTFVLPHDSREVQAMISSIVGVLVACSGVVSGIVALRYFAHRVPLLRELVMPELTAEQFAERNQREAMVSWDHLLGQTGRAMTVLRPAGKARFGEDVVAVVADGAYVSAGERIRVIKVQGNRVSVERVEDA